MSSKNPRPPKGEQDKTLYKHGNHAQIDQEECVGHAYVTNALTQYDVPIGSSFKEETDLAVSDAKHRVDENHK